MNTITARHIGKRIQKACVLKDVNLELEGGRIYAFQGENGSGQTMLFRVLSGLSLPTEGQILYNGVDLHAKRRPQFNIGIVIEHASVFPQFTGMQNLLYLAKINNRIGETEVAAAMQRVGLEPYDARVVKKYSLGMKQRLLIAQAIMERPDFLFLDEPTSAIDKAGVTEVYEIVRQEAARGAVVLLTSHVDQDISALADVCYQMRNGEIVNEA